MTWHIFRFRTATYFSEWATSGFESVAIFYSVCQSINLMNEWTKVPSKSAKQKCSIGVYHSDNYLHYVECNVREYQWESWIADRCYVACEKRADRNPFGISSALRNIYYNYMRASLYIQRLYLDISGLGIIMDN